MHAVISAMQCVSAAESTIEKENLFYTICECQFAVFKTHLSIELHEKHNKGSFV